MIDQLPRESRYVEALSQDEQLAERLAARPEPAKGPRRRMSDWTVQVELLTAILNRLGELTQAVAVLGGAKPRKVQAAPVPATALETIRNRRRFAKHKSLVARVLPHRHPPAGE